MTSINYANHTNYTESPLIKQNERDGSRGGFANVKVAIIKKSNHTITDKTDVMLLKW